MTIQDASPKTVDGIMDRDVVVNRWQLQLERQEFYVVLAKGFSLLMLAEG
jgi:hypothetical protein